MSRHSRAKKSKPTGQPPREPLTAPSAPSCNPPAVLPASPPSSFNLLPSSLPSDSAPPRRLPPLLRSAWFGLNQTFRRRIAHLGLTPNQYTILRWLTEHEPAGLTPGDLTSLMASDPNTIVATLQRMAAAGWITREVHPADRRKLQIHIRPPGTRLFLRGRVFALALQAEVLALIPAPKQAEFLDHLARIAAYCRPDTPPAAATRSAKRPRKPPNGSTPSSPSLPLSP